MRNMKKLVAWILGLVMLLGLGAAAAENPLPEIPTFTGTLNVRPITTAEEAEAYAREFWALDYVGVELGDAPLEVLQEPTEEDDTWLVEVQLEDGFADVAFNSQGNVAYMENMASGWSDPSAAEAEEEEVTGEDEAVTDDEATEDALVEWRGTLDRKVEYPFLAEVNPAVYEEYTALYPVNEGNNEYLTHYYDTYTLTNGEFDLNYSELYSDGTFRIKIVVQTKPVVRIVFFYIYCEPDEGGNG